MPAQASIAILSPSLILKRRLKASPENVYAAWTDPAKLKQWFRPGSGPVLPGTKLDVREGGHYTIAVGGEDGEEHRASGVYREVVPGPQARLRLGLGLRARDRLPRHGDDQTGWRRVDPDIDP
jgi:uncharacterized protein YndB with AHSA1/START domain